MGNMLIVPAYLAPSRIHGTGLFAETFIKEGTTVWKYNKVIDRRFTRRGLRLLASQEPTAVLVHICTYSYKRRGYFWYMGDNARFINHVQHGANVGLVDDHHEVALRDIQAGEELVENYLDNYDSDDFFVLEQQQVDFSCWLASPAPESVRRAAS